MFLEPVSMTFITLPTIYPLMQAAGYDLIWFGIMLGVNMQTDMQPPQPAELPGHGEQRRHTHHVPQ